MSKKITITLFSMIFILLMSSSMKARANSCSDNMAMHHHEQSHPAINEHMSIFNNLVACSQVTVSATKSGDWFDASIWDSNEVPGSKAHVFIPKNLKVTYGAMSNARLATLRVDGTLEFLSNKNSKLMVETIVTAPDSSLIIGSKNNPIAANKKVEIIFLDNGVIDLTKDPEQLGRGLVGHGDTIINGQEKTVFLKLKEDAKKGDSKIILSEKPLNWSVGDRLVLSATSFDSDKGKGFANRRKTQDEVLYLTGINELDENTFEVLFDGELEYDHVGLKPEHKAYLANYSRNIVFKTELKDFNSYEDLPAHRRAHIMFMHGKSVDVRYAEFFELGRTDKSMRMGKSESKGNNFVGRYALHFHRLGVGVDSKPAIALGNSVWGSPGFGYVHHDSYAIMTDNAAYNVFGTAFVAESGNETGIWQDNISIKTVGFKDRDNGHPKEAKGSFDIGRGGVGYWFQSRLVYSFHNIAVSNPGWGFVYFHRPTSNSIYIDYQDIDVPEIGRYRFKDPGNVNRKQVHIDSPNIQGFEKFNEAIATNVGLEVIKNHPVQGHDKRTILKEFTAWNVLQGVHLDYTGHYILDDIKVYGHKDAKQYIYTSNGITLSARLFDIVIKNSHVENFEKAVKVFLRVGEFDVKDSIILLDLVSVNNTVRIDRNTSPDNIIDTSLANYSIKPVKLLVSNESNLKLNGSLKIVANKQDSFGEYKLYDFPRESGLFEDRFDANFKELLRKVYYTLPSGEKVALWGEIISDRITGDLRRYELITPFNGNPEPGAVNGGTLDAKKVNGVWVLENHAPYVVRDFLTVADGETVSNIESLILANDRDYENDDIKVLSIEAPKYGTIVKEADGSYKYEAPSNFNGIDYFNYTISDGLHDSTAELRSKGLVRIWVDSYFSSNPDAEINPDVEEDTEDDTVVVDEADDINVEINPEAISLALIDAQTNTVINNFTDSILNINLSELSSNSVNFAAEPALTGGITSVKFTSSLGNKTERAAPYALFGDTAGNFLGKELSPGTYDLQVEVFNGTNVLASKNYLIIVSDEPSSDDNEEPDTVDDVDENDDTVVEDEPTDIFTVSLEDVITQNILAGYESVDEIIVIDLNTLEGKELNFTTNVNSDLVKAIKYVSTTVKAPEDAIFGVIDGTAFNFTMSVFHNIEASGDALAEKQFSVVFEETEEEPVVEEEPELIEEPVIEEPVVIIEEPVIDETPVIDEEPVVEEEPVIEEPTVVEDDSSSLITLSLVNAKTNTIVDSYDNLATSSVIDFNALALDGVNFIANVDSSILSEVKLVEFKSQGMNRTERGAPYTWFGDNKGNYFSRDLNPGVYNLTVNVVSKSGDLLASKVFTIEIK